MAFSPSGLILATAGLDRTVRFWDVKGFKELVGDADVKRKDEVSLLVVTRAKIHPSECWSLSS